MDLPTAFAPAATSEPTVLTSRPIPLIVLQPVIPARTITIMDKDRISFFIGFVDAKIGMFWLLFFLKNEPGYFTASLQNESCLS